jgi:hypothetical protein
LYLQKLLKRVVRGSVIDNGKMLGMRMWYEEEEKKKRGRGGEKRDKSWEGRNGAE